MRIMAVDTVVRCRVSAETKALLHKSAAREHFTESALVRQLIETLVRSSSSDTSVDRHERESRGERMSVRLAPESQLAGMTGSYGHALQLLAIGPSAVRSRVRSLESDLGVLLFQLGRRRLTLTEAGATYLREVEAAFVTFDLSTADLRARFAEPIRTHPENPRSCPLAAGASSLSAEHGHLPKSR